MTGYAYVIFYTIIKFYKMVLNVGVGGNVNNLLRILLNITDFDRVRLYVMNPVRSSARLVYAVNKLSSQTEVDKWGALVDIDFDYHKFFGKRKEPINKKSYKELICRFWDGDTFFVWLSDLVDIPEKVNENHLANGVGCIAMTKLVINGEEYFGHMAFDRSMREDSSICDADVENIDNVMILIREPLIKEIQDEVFARQYDEFVSLIDDLLLRIQTEDSDSQLLEFLMRGVIKICPSIDLLQVKQVDLNNDACRYVSIVLNKDNWINSDEKEKYDLIVDVLARDGWYKLDDNQNVTKEVVRTQSTIYFKNMKRASEYYTGGFKKTIDDEKYDEWNPVNIIRSRNNSEINVPLKYGKYCYGVIDAHGKRPYSIDANVVRVMNLVAQWVMVIIKRVELQKSKGMDEIYNRFEFGRHVSDGGNDVKLFYLEHFNRMLKDGVMDVVKDGNTIKDQINDVMFRTEYNNVVRAYRGGVEHFMWFKYAKYASYWMLAISLLSLILYASGNNGYNIISPFFGMIGIFVCPVLILMSEMAEKRFIKRLDERQEGFIAEYLVDRWRVKK